MSIRIGRIAIPVAFAAMVFGPTLAFAQSPDQFIKNAVKGNVSEVKLGKLAEQRGATDAVRSFGHMLVTDHMQAAADAVSVAKEIHVAASAQPSEEADQFYEKAVQLKGKAFDTAFVKYMIEAHQKAIEEYTEQAADQSSKPVAEYATKALPALKKHLETAQQIQKE